MSLVNTITPPKLAWQFDGTTTPYIGSVSSTTQRGTLNYTTPGKYSSSLNIQNPAGSTSNSVNWNFGTATYSIDAGFSFAFWIRFNDLSYLTSIQQFITFYYAGGNPLRFQLNTSGGMQFQFTDSVGQKNTNMFTPVAGVWYHLALVGSAGNITAYRNGSTTYGPMAYVQTGITFNTAFLGVTSSPSNPVTNADYDDLRIYNTALSAAQVQSIYNQQGMPGLGTLITTSAAKTTLTGTPLFTQLSQAATSSAVGAFSLRAVNGTTALAVNVRNGTTSATQDFYADRLGNLLTAPVTGQPLATWLGGATGYVTTWYDQSGKGNHATQATTANQPIIQRATKGPGYSCLFNGTTNYMNFGSSTILNGTNYSVCGSTRRNVSGGGRYYIGSAGTNLQFQQLSVGYFTDTSTILNEGAYAQQITVPAYAGASEPVTYENWSMSQTTGIYDFSWRAGATYNNGNLGLKTPLSSAGNGIIGATASNGSYSGYFSGEMFELLIFTASLFDLSGSSIGQLSPIPSIIQTIYNNQLGYTGA